MRKKSVLSVLEQNSLVGLNQELIIFHHTFSAADLMVIKQRRGIENRLGFAVQLCYMRYPGISMPENPNEKVIEYAATQLDISSEFFDNYGKRKNTIYDHSIELQTLFGFSLFTMVTYSEQLELVESNALQTDKALFLATNLVTNLRIKKILLPSIAVIERLCVKAIINANYKIYDKLTDKLTESHRKKLDDLLKIKPDSKFTWLAWLRQSPKKVSTIQILEHIERLKKLNELQLTEQHTTSSVHQNRLLKIAREGSHMTVQHLMDFEDKRRYATLVALVIESTATITDEIIDLHDRIIEKLFSTAKNTHQKQFQQSGKAINNQMLLYSKIGQALLDAKQNETDPFAAIESVISWEDFETSITDVQSLTQPDATITETGLKITPIETSVPKNAKPFVDKATTLLPRVKITELLLEVDQWTNFTEHFTHLKSNEMAEDKTLLLTAILADGINLGLSKMSESCPGVTYSKLSWLQDWHIRDETYSAALAVLTNAQLKQPFAAHWGNGTTSSSDGQPFQTANGAKGKGQVNPKNGSEPNRQLYTHVSDQYSPFSSRIINVGVRDATYVLDGLLYHESDLRIEEHYTDTAGFTDQVFGMMHLLGFKLAPRIRNLSEIKLFTPPKQNKNYSALQAMISGEEINVNRIKKCGMKFNAWRFQFNKVLRLRRCCYANSVIIRVKMV
jgi:TnpA family transposase